MVEFTELVAIMNEVHVDKGGTYDEGTAPRIIQLASQVYNDDKQAVLEADRDEMYRTVTEIYTP